MGHSLKTKLESLKILKSRNGSYG